MAVYNTGRIVWSIVHAAGNINNETQKWRRIKSVRDLNNLIYAQRLIKKQ